MTQNSNNTWQTLCTLNDLIPNSGVAALYEDQQIALFYLPDLEQKVYAVHNHDPFSGANVIARGLIGDIKGELTVVSPLYKQHFSLSTGQCLEDAEVALNVWPVRISGENVELLVS